MESSKLTGWTDEELFLLSNSLNHKIVKLESGDYMWKHKLSNLWVNHCVDTFEDYSKAHSFLHYSLAKWIGELKSRNEEKAKAHNVAMRKLRLIKRSVTRTVADKIREISALGLNFNHQELASEMGVSTKTVQRALKLDHARESSFGVSKPRRVDNKAVYNPNAPQEVRVKSQEYLDYVKAFNEKINNEL
jgi:hypothetical protein